MVMVWMRSGLGFGIDPTLKGKLCMYGWFLRKRGGERECVCVWERGREKKKKKRRRERVVAGAEVWFLYVVIHAKKKTRGGRLSNEFFFPPKKTFFSVSVSVSVWELTMRVIESHLDLTSYQKINPYLWTTYIPTYLIRSISISFILNSLTLHLFSLLTYFFLFFLDLFRPAFSFITITIIITIFFFFFTTFFFTRCESPPSSNKPVFASCENRLSLF